MDNSPENYSGEPLDDVVHNIAEQQELCRPQSEEVIDYVDLTIFPV